MLKPHHFDDVSLLVSERDFHDEAHGVVFSHMARCFESKGVIDPTVVFAQLKKAGDLDRAGGAGRLGGILHHAPEGAHSVYYAEIVRDKAILRRLIEAADAALHDACEGTADAEDIVAQAEQRFFEVSERSVKDEPVNSRELLMRVMESIEARRDGDVVRTGYSGLDGLLGGGLRGNELVILAARPSMGKTALALNIAEYTSLRDVATLFVSLEMSAIALGDRLLSARARVNGHRLRSGAINSDDRERVMRAVGDLSEAKLHVIDNAGVTTRQIAAHARRLKRKHGLGLIVIDYLQLINPVEARVPRQEQVAAISRDIKAISKQVDVPVIVLAQLNRQTETAKDNQPRLSHLRESGALEQDADVVLFVHREEYYNATPDNIGKAEIIVAKQRNGPTGAVKVLWRKEFTKFEEEAPDRYEVFDDHNDEEPLL